jgi:hypothetical protein
MYWRELDPAGPRAVALAVSPNLGSVSYTLRRSNVRRMAVNQLSHTSAFQQNLHRFRPNSGLARRRIHFEPSLERKQRSSTSV